MTNLLKLRPSAQSTSQRGRYSQDVEVSDHIWGRIFEEIFNEVPTPLKGNYRSEELEERCHLLMTLFPRAEGKQFEVNEPEVLTLRNLMVISRRYRAVIFNYTEHGFVYLLTCLNGAYFISRVADHRGEVKAMIIPHTYALSGLYERATELAQHYWGPDGRIRRMLTRAAIVRGDVEQILQIYSHNSNNYPRPSTSVEELKLAVMCGDAEVVDCVLWFYKKGGIITLNM